MDKDIHAAQWALKRHENNNKSNLSPYQVRNIKKFIVSKSGEATRARTPKTGRSIPRKDKSKSGKAARDSTPKTGTSTTSTRVSRKDLTELKLLTTRITNILKKYSN